MRENKRDLWGHEFDVVREGLSESQVVTFVNNLLEEQKRLQQSQEHLASLTKLAEVTVMEADRLAANIAEEAKQKAEADMARVIAEAEQQARESAQEKEAHVLAEAEREAQSMVESAKIKVSKIEAEAKQEEELQIEQKRAHFEREFKDEVMTLYSRLLSELESVQVKVKTMSKDWENKVSEWDERKSTDPSSATEYQPLTEMLKAEESVNDLSQEDFSHSEPSEVSGNGRKPSEQSISVTPDDEESSGQDVPRVFEEALLNSMEESDTQSDNELETEQNDTVPVEAEPEALYQGEVELVVLPPVTTAQMVGLQGHLRRQPGIAIKEIKASLSDNSFLTLYLDRAVPLEGRLREISGTQIVEEELEKSSDSPSENGRRLCVSLCQS